MTEILLHLYCKLFYGYQHKALQRINILVYMAVMTINLCDTYFR